MVAFGQDMEKAFWLRTAEQNPHFMSNPESASASMWLNIWDKCYYNVPTLVLTERAPRNRGTTGIGVCHRISEKSTGMIPVEPYPLSGPRTLPISTQPIPDYRSALLEESWKATPS